MKVRKEYTVSFPREEIDKFAGIVGYIHGLNNELEVATCDIVYGEYSSVLQQLEDSLDRAKRALDECYNIITDYCES